MSPIESLRLTARTAGEIGGAIATQGKAGGMIVTVFRSRLMPGVRDDYVTLVDRMVELAAAMPGYISHKGFFADDGERVTIVEFESEEAQRAWRMHPEHRDAQREAREIYYASYSVQVCEVKRELKFDRNERGVAAE
jgi:heme-degrading monooxygenase HmoA